MEADSSQREEGGKEREGNEERNVSEKVRNKQVTLRVGREKSHIAVERGGDEGGREMTTLQI